MARNGGNNLEAFSIVIPKVLLSSTTTQRFRAGYGSTTNPNFVAYDVLTGSVALQSAMLDNSNTTSTTRTSVLYR